MSNEQQIEHWNGETGDTWVAYADSLDLMLKAVGDTVLERAQLKVGHRVLDIGCGTGAMTRNAQLRVGNEDRSGGQVLGLDVSRPMVLEARRRADQQRSRAKFIEADASTWRSDAPLDDIISRFGVMFFDDPTTAFANLVRSIKSGGRLTFACWRGPKENDLGCGLMKAIEHLVTPPAVKPDPTAPGPFAFSEPKYVESLLTKAGWRDVDFSKWDGPLPLSGTTARDNARDLSRLGAISRAIREQNIPVDLVIEALTPLLEQRQQGGKFALTGAAWIVSATK